VATINAKLLSTDLKAGLTVGVVLVPQAVAYAFLAELPPIYGLYASLVPLLIYAILGSSPQLAFGVNAIDMLLVAGGAAAVAIPGSDEYVAAVILLAAITGVIQLAMGLLRLGFIVTLLSRPVSTGFISGAALIIAVNQIGGLLGFEMPSSSHVYELAMGLIRNVGQAHAMTAVVGVVSVAFIWYLKRIRPEFPAGLTAVALATLATWFFDLETQGLAVVGFVPSGLPMPALPVFGRDLASGLLPTAIGLGLFQFMTVASLGRAYAAKSGYRVQANRDLSATGIANVVGSFFQAIPVSGSFSRTSILYSFGQTTKLANALAAIVVGITIAFLTPVFNYVPEAALSALIIVAVIKLVDWREAKYLLGVKRVDGVIALITFLTTIVFGVLAGIGIGVAASVFAVMYRISRPNLAVLGHIPGTRSYRDIKRNRRAVETEGVLMVRLDASFSFANADFVRDKVLRFVKRKEDTRWVVLDGSGINDLDMTAAAILVDIAETLRGWGVELYITGLKGSVRDTVSGTVLAERIGKDHLLMTPHRAMKRIRAGLDAREANTPP
jgi:SulP family sulfate permease